MNYVGENIKKRRIFLGMSQDKLAELMGYKSRSTIAKIESGVNDVVQSNIVKFAQCLNTTPAYLMGWDTEKIEEIAEQQKAASDYQIEVEQILYDLAVALADADLPYEDLQKIKAFTEQIKQSSDTSLLKSSISTFLNINNLNLSKDELNAVYTYAQMLQNNKRGD